MTLGAALVAALAVHAAPVERGPLAVCAALEGEGFQGVSGPPRWMDYGTGDYGCAADIDVGPPDHVRLLASAVEFMAESKDKASVQKVTLSASLYNAKTKALTLKRLRNVALELFRAMALEVPENVFAAIEKPRAEFARMPYGGVRFARTEGVNIEMWTLTVALDVGRTPQPAPSR